MIPTGTGYVKFLSHILITKNGMACTYPPRSKKDINGLRYAPWCYVGGFRKDRFMIKLDSTIQLKTFRTIFFKLSYIKTYETLKSFKKRSIQFPLKIAPFFIEAKNKWILEQNELGNKVPEKEIKAFQRTLKFYEGLKKKFQNTIDLMK